MLEQLLRTLGSAPKPIDGAALNRLTAQRPGGAQDLLQRQQQPGEQVDIIALLQVRGPASKAAGGGRCCECPHHSAAHHSAAHACLMSTADCPRLQPARRRWGHPFATFNAQIKLLQQAQVAMLVPAETSLSTGSTACWRGPRAAPVACSCLSRLLVMFTRQLGQTRVCRPGVSTWTA